MQLTLIQVAAGRSLDFIADFRPSRRAASRGEAFGASRTLEVESCLRDIELEAVIVLLIANILPGMYTSGKLFQVVQVRKIPVDPSWSMVSDLSETMSSDQGVNLFTTIPYLTAHLQQGQKEGRMASSSSSMSRRHIPYLSFHKQIVREICRPQKDDLLLLAKGLGMRRVSSHLSCRTVKAEM